MKAKAPLIVALLVLLSVAGTFAADWPWYYGPRRDGTSTEKGLLRTWPKEGPKVLWSAPLGVGFGGPAVSRGKVYLLDRDEKVGDTLRVYDFATGKQLWTFAYDAPGSFMFNGSRPPAAPPSGRPGPPSGPPPGQAGAQGRGFTPPAPGSQLPTWAITQNPLIYRTLVIVASQAPQAGVVAYDKLTGELKWKTEPLSGGVGYASPSIVKVAGEDHLVMVTAAAGMGRNASGGSANGLDPLTGKLLWSYTNWQCRIPVGHGVDAGEGRVLLAGGYGAGSALFRVQKKTDGGYEVTELFKNPDFGSHTQPPIVYKDHFYAQYTINERSDGLVCMTMDGQVRWKTGEEPPFSKDGAVLADGLLLAVDGNTKLYLTEPDPAGFKPLANAELLEPSNNWAPIALVDGKLLIRDQKGLKCVQVAQKGRP